MQARRPIASLRRLGTDKILGGNSYYTGKCAQLIIITGGATILRTGYKSFASGANRIFLGLYAYPHFVTFLGYISRK